MRRRSARVLFPRDPFTIDWHVLAARSPDGHFILTTSFDHAKFYLFDVKANTWSTIYQERAASMTWSHDSRFLFFLRYANDPAVMRMPARGGVPAVVVVALKDFRYRGTFGLWFGLDSTDAPLLLRDEGTEGVYALTLGGSSPRPNP